MLKELTVTVCYDDSQWSEGRPFGSSVAEEQLREIDVWEVRAGDETLPRDHPVYSALEKYVHENPDAGEVDDNV